MDLSVREAAYHPMTTPWPDAQPSPFADWFAGTASIRDPVIWGFCPEDGSALAMELFSAIGGRAVGVIGMTGSGKSNLLNGAREKVTRCEDARLVQLNGAHMGDELIWEPLSALTLCGPVRTDEEVRDKIAAALEALCLLVTNRSATLAETGHSTFQPTPDDPAVEHHHRRGRRDRRATCPARARPWNSSPPSSANPRCASCWPPSAPSSRRSAAARSAPT